MVGLGGKKHVSRSIHRFRADATQIADMSQWSQNLDWDGLWRLVQAAHFFSPASHSSMWGDAGVGLSGSHWYWDRCHPNRRQSGA